MRHDAVSASPSPPAPKKKTKRLCGGAHRVVSPWKPSDWIEPGGGDGGGGPAPCLPSNDDGLPPIQQACHSKNSSFKFEQSYFFHKFLICFPRLVSYASGIVARKIHGLFGIAYHTHSFKYRGQAAQKQEAKILLLLPPLGEELRIRMLLAE